MELLQNLVKRQNKQLESNVIRCNELFKELQKDRESNTIRLDNLQLEMTNLKNTNNIILQKLENLHQDKIEVVGDSNDCSATL
jgi:hypothetical protein